jgi:segregation and condensation protein B
MTPTTITPTETEDNVIDLRQRATKKAEEKAAAKGAPKKAKKRSAADPVEEGTGTLRQRVEALLFVSSTPLTLDVLAEATTFDADEVEGVLLDMMQSFSEQESGIVLERVSGGWAFRAADCTRDTMARMFDPQADTKLSPAALETVAVVAYLQPISRPDVARIRGVSVDAAMTNLLDRGFVEEAGRSQSGAVLFRTTALFERAFGLQSVSSLPEIDGFAPGPDEMARLREQLEQMASARVE